VPESAQLVKAAEKAGKHNLKRECPAKSLFHEAVDNCRAKVRRIAAECRATNRRYRDVHFDLECSPRKDTIRSLGKEIAENDVVPRSVKRVPEIFDSPKFFVDGEATNDVVQGTIGDCWFIA
jgi:hypothetical protein